MKLFYILAVILLISGCNFFDKKKSYPTEFKYKNNVIVPDYMYSNDSLKFVLIFKYMIKNKISPYHGDKFDDKTVVYIDSIIYSPDTLYAISFTVFKCYNGSMKVIPYDLNKNEYHFDGIIHYFKKTNEANSDCHWKLSEHHGIHYFCAENYNKISQIFRRDSFNGRSHYVNDSTKQEYNLDDIRFWYSKEFQSLKSDDFYDVLSLSDE